MSISPQLLLDDQEVALIRQIEQGLPLVSRPYAAIGSVVGLSEDAVLMRLESLIQRGIIKRFGVIVRHRSLGYRANAMVVFDIPEEEMDRVSSGILQQKFVTLCYERPRQLPSWPYNLFLMIHGKERWMVEDQIQELKVSLGLLDYPSATLFSCRCFKQRGARYFYPEVPEFDDQTLMPTHE